MVRADTQASRRRLLRDLRKQYGESAQAFGIRLAEITGARPYTRSYISLMESGAVGISEVVMRALQILAAEKIMVAPAPGVVLSPGCIIQKSEQLCERDGCEVRFIPAGRSRYCSPACRRKKTKEVQA